MPAGKKPKGSLQGAAKPAHRGKTKKLKRPNPPSNLTPDQLNSLEMAKRVEEFRARHPGLMARLSLLSVLAELQEVLGGEFPDHVAFVHTPDYVYNIRRVGRVDLEALIVGLEVYEMGDIRPGILWLPLDHIVWVGTTNEPIGAEKIGLESRHVSAYTPTRGQYERARRRLAGLLPADAPTAPPPAADREAPHAGR